MSSNGSSPGLRSGVAMRPSDAFFWYAEAASPEIRPLVAGLFMLDRAPHPKRFRAAIERLIRLMPRLRQRVVEAPAGLTLPSWYDDVEFDLDYHLREVVLPPPATFAHLLRFAGEAFSAPLDHLRPLWEAQLVGGLAGGGAALFLKVHHAVLDGVGANALVDAMTQGHRPDPVPQARPGARPGPAADDPPLWRLVRGGAALAGSAARVLIDPTDAVHQVAHLARGIGGLMAEMAGASPAPAEGNGRGIGRAIAAVTLSLPRMRGIKSRLGITLNDLVLTVVSGAVARYRSRHGLAGDAVSCMVPVNLRQDHERADLGNRVGGFVIQLPLAEPDPLERLASIRTQTQTAKRGGHGAVYQLFMQAGAFIPAAVFRSLTHRIAGRIQLICSNVPGPAAVRFLAGARIDAIYPFAPVMLGTPLAIALVSYGANYCIGIAADPVLFPDPQRLAGYLEREVDEIEGRSAAHSARGVHPTAAP